MINFAPHVGIESEHHDGVIQRGCGSADNVVAQFGMSFFNGVDFVGLPECAEQGVAAKLVDGGEFKRDQKLDAAELASWTMVANLVLNLDEVINKN